LKESFLLSVCVQCVGLGAVQQAECFFGSKPTTHSHHVLGVYQRTRPGFTSYRRRSLVTLVTSPVGRVQSNLMRMSVC